MLKTRNFLL